MGSRLRAVGAVALLVGGAAWVPAARGAVASTTCTAFAHVPTSTTEVVDVLAPSARATHATLTLYRQKGACFVAVGGPYAAWVGADGLSAHHREGDDTTPIGTFAFESEMYGIAPDPGVHYRYHRLVCGDWWDEDPTSAQYNEFVHVPCGTTPHFGGESEALWTEAPAYDLLAVVAYNTSPSVPGRGSGIFLHQSTGTPTAGCVALDRSALLATLGFLTPAAHPRITIGVG